MYLILICLTPKWFRNDYIEIADAFFIFVSITYSFFIFLSEKMNEIKFILLHSILMFILVLFTIANGTEYPEYLLVRINAISDISSGNLKYRASADMIFGIAFIYLFISYVLFLFYKVFRMLRII